MQDDVVVGLDLGSSRVKAVAFDPAGAVVAATERETPRRPAARPGEDDFGVLAVLDAAADAVLGLGLTPGRVAGLGLSSMGEVGTALVDGRLADVTFPAWYDPRGSEVVERLEARLGAARLSEATGNHTVTCSTLAKVGHLVDAGERWSGTFLGLCGALAWRLTGEGWQEAGLATTSGAYDPLTGRWVPELWAAAGLDGLALPEVRPPGSGRPAATALARRLGLREGATVVISGHDHPVATLGAGVVPGEVADSLGTGQAILAGLEPDADTGPTRAALVDDPDLSLEVWPGDGRTLVVWGRLRPGLAMRTFLEASPLGRRTLERDAPPPGEAGRVGAEAVVALERGHVPSGLTLDARAWGALLDHYVLAAQEGRDRLRRLTGADGTTVLTGGGLRSRRWRHAHAALADGELAVSTVTETVARGAAAVVGASLGWWPSSTAMPGATRVVVRPGRTADVDLAAQQLGLDTATVG
jgi:sugar (pentulose or hexulose) kinase